MRVVRHALSRLQPLGHLAHARQVKPGDSAAIIAPPKTELALHPESDGIGWEAVQNRFP